jgi:glycosyltransferase involved in cell wall biosynthesis
MPRPTVSVTIIAKNEAHNLRECLASVKWADELIVVDSGSTDGTCDIARKMGARVISTPDWPGFGAQKNRALAQATSDWVLSIDADERVTPALANEIRQAVQTAGQQAFSSPRLTYFLGQPVRHCGWYPDDSPRLFRRGRGRFSDHLVHEHIILDDPVTRLRSDLLHHSYRSMADVDKKVQDYGRAGSRQLIKAGKQVAAPTPYIKSGWAWVRTYLIRAGFLDGMAGLAIARMNARTTFLKYSLARHPQAQGNTR